jgi:hypothetical protein
MFTVFVVALEKEVDRVLRFYIIMDIFHDFFYAFGLVEIFGDEDESIFSCNVVIGCD